MYAFTCTFVGGEAVAGGRTSFSSGVGAVVGAEDRAKGCQGEVRRVPDV